MLIKLQTTSLTIFCVYYIGDEENSENAEFILCHVLATEFANGNFYQFLSPHSCFARAQFSYTMDATLPSFPAFDPSPEAGDVALRWRKWVSRFRILLAAINVTNDTRKKSLLLHYAGERVSDIFDTLTIPDPTGDESSTELAINALTLFFAPYANVEFAVFQFRQAKQEQTVDIASYLTRLRQLALNCDFSDVSRELKSQIIQGCRSTRLRRRALTDPTITLDNIVNLARVAKAADAHTSAMTSDTIPELVSRLKTHPSSSTTPHSRSTGKNQSTCRNCGRMRVVERTSLRLTKQAGAVRSVGTFSPSAAVLTPLVTRALHQRNARSELTTWKSVTLIQSLTWNISMLFDPTLWLQNPRCSIFFWTVYPSM